MPPEPSKRPGGPNAAQYGPSSNVDLLTALPGYQGRLPPHSPEAEQGLLSCCLLDPSEAYPKAAELACPEWFYELRHRDIWQAMEYLSENGGKIDLITLIQRLKDTRKLNGPEGSLYISELSDKAPSPANLPEYIKILRSKFLMRRLMALCGTTSAAIMDGAEEADDLINEFEREALNVREIRAEGKQNKEIAQQLIADLEQEAKGPLPGTITTGYPDWDYKFQGYPPGSLVILAGRPSTGKTASALQQIRHSLQHHKVGFFSIEMTAKACFRRMAGAESGVNIHPREMANLMNSPAMDRDRKRLVMAVGKFANTQSLIVEDRSSISIQQISSIARRWKKSKGVGLIVVDYLQIVSGSSKRGRDDRRLEVAEVARGLKRIAKDLHLVVIALAQLNREIEGRSEGSRPRLRDLKEAGEIEQEADFVEFLWYEKDPLEQEDHARPNVIRTVAKNREGPIGDVRLIFNKPLQRFESPSRIEE